MATDQTCGAPPSRGSTILVNIGCTAKRSAALRKMAAVSTGKSGLVWAESVAGRSVVLMLDLSAVTTAVASGGEGRNHGPGTYANATATPEARKRGNTAWMIRATGYASLNRVDCLQ